MYCSNIGENYFTGEEIEREGKILMGLVIEIISMYSFNQDLTKQSKKL